jgi:hypothetical protein
MLFKCEKLQFSTNTRKSLLIPGRGCWPGGASVAGNQDGTEPFIDDTLPAARPDNERATTMWFLIKGAFWFSLVLVMLPIFDQDATDRLSQEKGVELTDALGAAAGAISYATDLCAQKPDVCVKGAETFTTLGTRAREGARVAYTYLDTQFADETAAKKADTVLTGTVAAKADASNPIKNIPIPVPRPKA